MSPDLRGTTSRRALIIGMTNTDQIGFQQAGPATAEVIPDVDDGAGAPGSEEVNEQGLTAAEQALFDGMRTGDVPADPAAGDDQDGDGSGDPDGGAGDPAGGDPDGTGALARDQNDKAAPWQPGEQAPVDGKGAQKPPKTVNYSKYQRELQRANTAREAAETAARKEREDRIKLTARVDLINEALAAQRQSAEQAAAAAQADPNALPENPFDEQDIDPAEDYAGAVAQVNRRTRYQYDHQQQLQQTVQTSNDDRQLKDTFERDFRAYASTPEGKDLPAAYQFLKDSRLTEICITKFDKDPNDPNEVFTPAEVQEMVNLFNQEEKWVVSNALTQKKSPAQAILKLARSRGFKPVPAPAPQPRPAPGARPAAPAARVPAVVPRAPAAPAAPTSEDATAALAALRQNQEDGRSLSDGGGVPPGGLTAEMLLKLNDTEFGELVDSLNEHQLQALMGRDFPGGR
jgi:hypothetical protein